MGGLPGSIAARHLVARNRTDDFDESVDHGRGQRPGRSDRRPRHLAVEGLSGSSSASDARIKQKLERSGYSQIQLHENAANQWNGTAMKNGRQVKIDVTPDGSVVEK